MNTLNKTMSTTTITVITPPETEPVTVEQLKAHLRLNDNSEDSLLALYITVAREFFEGYTGRAVHPTTFRQHFETLTGRIYLRRSVVSRIDGIFYFNDNYDPVEIEEYYKDIISIPASFWLEQYPAIGKNIKPAGYVEFTAGWETSEVPAMVKHGIQLGAAHFYTHRESHNVESLNAIPLGFKAICDRYKTEVRGEWNGLRW